MKLFVFLTVLISFLAYYIYLEITDPYKPGKCIYTYDLRYTPEQQVSVNKILQNLKDRVNISTQVQKKWVNAGTLKKSVFEGSEIFKYVIDDCPDKRKKKAVINTRSIKNFKLKR